MLAKMFCSRYRENPVQGGRVLIAGGLSCLLLANLLRLFGGPSPAGDFFQGFFTGLSLVFNLAGLGFVCARKKHGP